MNYFETLTDEQIENRMDQLMTLGILPISSETHIKIKFSEKYINTFATYWEYYYNQKLEFKEKIYNVSIMTLDTLHPELNKDDVYELSHVCMFIWIGFYQLIEKDYTKFLELERGKPKK